MYYYLYYYYPGINIKYKGQPTTLTINMQRCTILVHMVLQKVLRGATLTYYQRNTVSSAVYLS